MKKEPINIATAAQLAMKPATPMRLGLEISKSGCLNQGRRGAGTMPAGKVLWEELCYRYHAGADYVKAMRRKWAALEKHIDNDIYLHVQEKQATQENDAIIWRDTCVSYFQEFSKSLVPAFSDKVIIE